MKNPTQNVQPTTKINKELQTPDEKELARYEKQLEALKEDSDYNNFEAKRKLLTGFYEENITRLRAKTDTARAKDKRYTGEVVQPYASG